MTYLKDFAVKADDSASTDAFSRWRTSGVSNLLNSKNLFDNTALYWDDKATSGTGTSSTYNANQASVTLGVSNTTAGTRVRQSKKRPNYIAGNSHLCIFTGVIGSGASGITKRVGLFDDNNGLFFELSGTTLRIVRRTKTTGVVVDHPVDQVDWNIDTLDGNGRSGINLLLTKTQIMVIDFQWLGVGRVRFGFDIDGVIVYCHELLNANRTLSTVYMGNPNLPVRYEISNDGSGPASSLVQICSAVLSEGGDREVGSIRTEVSGNSAINANTVGTTYAVLGMRVNSSYIGAHIDLIKATIVSTTAADSFRWVLYLNPTVTGTFNYSQLSNSAVDIAYGDTAGNPSAVTVASGILLDGGYSINDVNTAIPLEAAFEFGFDISGASDTIVLTVTPIGNGNIDIYGSLTWVELS